MNWPVIEIYTDGSCHTNFKIGAWAAILLFANEKVVLKGVVQNTTHNRMELLAVIKSIEFVDEKYDKASLVIYTDSQYVFRISERKEKLKKKQFLTKKGTPIQNSDLVKTLIIQIETHKIEFIKVKAHQKPENGPFNASVKSCVNYNCEVDKLARAMVREYIKRGHQGSSVI